MKFRTESVIGPLMCRRLGEMGPVDWRGIERDVDWGRAGETDRAYVLGVDADRGAKAKRLVAMMNRRRPIMSGLTTLDDAVAAGLLTAEGGEAFRGTRTAGKTKMLASDYTGMHNEGACWVDASGAYPFNGPWLPHPEPEVFHV